MHFNRHAYAFLQQWKVKKNRKPLILRGARQVGKTTLVKHFSASYANTISLNLERPEHASYFKKYTDAKTLVEVLFISNNITSDQKGNTLLFIDEIQESPEAIALLRYFYEDVPELHVIAAGSLLEHVMKNVKSFPVGRVEYLYVFPLNFLEYLEAKEQTSALEQIHKIPVAEIAHDALLNLYNEYAIIGGMPEVIATFLATQSVSDLPPVYESIWETYKSDIEKYAANNTDARIIRHILATAHLYVDQRIKFENFGKSNYRSREVGEAMRNLNDARIIQLIYPTTDVIPPIKPDHQKSPRLQYLDTGLINYELNIQADMLAMADLNTAYKGAIIPHLVTQEIISLNSHSYSTPHFWVREKTQSSSEVDLVMQYKDMVIPIEIKSGKEGKLKSLHQFMEHVNHPFAVRMYAGKFCIEKHETPTTNKPYLLMNLPYYLGCKINEYLSYFVKNHHI